MYRFENDRYDRIWTPESGGIGTRKLFGNSVISNPGWLDNPPPVVLRNAVAPIDRNATLVLDMGFPPVVASVYINWFFSEVTQLLPGQNRTFRISLNDAHSVPISPPFGNFSQFFASNYTVSPNSTVSLVPTNYSTLPPLINALEVYLIGDMTTNGTNVADSEQFLFFFLTLENEIRYAPLEVNI